MFASTSTGEWHDATAHEPIPKSSQTTALVARGMLMAPLPIQSALRARRAA